MGRPPKAFVSYSKTDAEFAERLARDLRLRGVSIWFDKWEMRVGESLIEKIEAGIKDHDFLVVLLSPASVDSPWVQKELRTALMRELAIRRVVVLPALIQECTIPEFLREKLYADFRTAYEDGLVALVQSMESLLQDNARFDAASSVASEWGVVRALHTTPSGRLFLSVTEDSILRLWRAPEGNLERALFPRRHVVDACLDPSGKLAVAGLTDDLRGGRLLVFETATGALLWSHFVGNDERPSFSAILGSANGVVSGFRDGTLLLTSYEESYFDKALPRAPFGVHRLALASDGRTLAVSGPDTGVCIGAWAGEFGDRVFCPGSRIYDIALSPTGGTLACATSQADGVFLFDTVTGDEAFRPHTDQVSAVAFSPDGSLLAAGDWDGGVYLYRAPAWQSIGAVRAHRRMVGAVAFCAAGENLITGGGREDPSITIWDVKTGRAVSTVKGSDWERGV